MGEVVGQRDKSLIGQHTGALKFETMGLISAQVLGIVGWENGWGIGDTVRERDRDQRKKEGEGEKDAGKII